MARPKRLHSKGRYFTRGDIFESIKLDQIKDKEGKTDEAWEEALNVHNISHEGRRFESYKLGSKGNLTTPNKSNPNGNNQMAWVGKVNSKVRAYTGFAKECWWPAETFIERQARSSNSKRKYAAEKRRSKLKDQDYTLTNDEAAKYVGMTCYYCGVESPEKGYHELDRIDSSITYTEENVVACCKDCNQAKGTKTQKEYKEFIERVSKWQK
jgi:hypothetical protein